MLNFPPCPAALRRIAYYLKTAEEHANRDIVVTYWCCLYALQTGLKISTKTPEETSLLIAIMEWLEKTKTENSANEAITNEVVAQAYLENYAYKLFNYANQQDLASNFGKNVVKAFFTSGMIYDALLTFGELSEEAQKNSKYSKWKATYIHNCLKNGETPVAGPATFDDEFSSELKDEGEEASGSSNVVTSSDPPPEPATSSNIADISPPTELPTPHPRQVQPVAPFSGDGFQAYTAPSSVVSSTNLTADQVAKAQKYCKWAGSALNYDDVPAAILNLQKALQLLQTGQDS